MQCNVARVTKMKLLGTHVAHVDRQKTPGASGEVKEVFENRHELFQNSDERIMSVVSQFSWFCVTPWEKRLSVADKLRLVRLVSSRRAHVFVER